MSSVLPPVPAPVLKKLSDAFAATMAEKPVRTALEQADLFVGKGGEDVAALIVAEDKKYREIAKHADMKE